MYCIDLPARYSSTGKASTVKLAWAMKFLKMPSSFHLSPSLNTLFKMYDRVALKVDKCRFPSSDLRTCPYARNTARWCSTVLEASLLLIRRLAAS